MSRQASANYTPEDVERVLVALAMNGGVVAAAERTLKAEGHRYFRDGIARARERHPQRYAELAAREMERISKLIAAEAEETVMRAAEAERSLLERLQGEVPHLDPRDLSRALRDVSTVKGINVDKASALRGRPATVVEHRSTKEIVSELARLGIVEGTATEEPQPALEAPKQ